MITMETKLEIIAKQKNGMHVIAIAREYGRKPSMITKNLSKRREGEASYFVD